MQRIANPWTSVRLREAPPLSQLNVTSAKTDFIDDQLKAGFFVSKIPTFPQIYQPQRDFASTPHAA